MSKLAYEVAALIDRRLEDAIAGLTPGALRPGIINNDVNAMRVTPIEPEMVRFLLQDLMPWVKALKEDLRS